MPEYDQGQVPFIGLSSYYYYFSSASFILCFLILTLGYTFLAKIGGQGGGLLLISTS